MRRVAVLALACLTACSSGSAAKPDRADQSASKDSPAVSGKRAIVIALTDPGRRSVTVYRIDQQRHATKMATITRPAWADFAAPVQQDVGANPGICVLFRDLSGSGPTVRSETWCYSPGGLDGRELSLGDEIGTVVLSPDGRTAISVTDTISQVRQLSVSRIQDRTATFERSVRLDGQHLRGCPWPGVQSAAWAGGPNITLECLGESGGYFVEQNLAKFMGGGSVGAGLTLRPRGSLANGYDALTQVKPLDADTAIAIMYVRHTCGGDYGPRCPGDLPRPEAVRVDLRTGTVLEVIAFAASGRDLTQVTGGSHGLLYVTVGGSEGSRVYIRWPGEKRGAQVTGLPADLDVLVAQH